MKSSFLLISLTMMATGLLGGCQTLYFLMPEPPPKYAEAEFAGLANHSLAVVVYADPDVLYEYPRARLDMSARLADELRRNVSGLRVTDPRSVIRYQDENLEWDTLDKTKLGKELGVQYVMYVALSRYTMHEPGSEYLFRGEITADVAVYDVSRPERQSRVYAINGFQIVHPPEPIPANDDSLIRAVAETQFVTTLAKKFYKHKVPNNE